MTWVRLDDGFADSPEMIEAGSLAFTVAIWALSYSARHLTDGRVPRAVLAGCPWVTKRSALEGACERLEVAGFWKPKADGYAIADPFAFLQKSDDVRKKRAASAERQARWRERQQARRNAASNGVTRKGRNAPPDPDPNPEGSEGRREGRNGCSEGDPHSLLVAPAALAPGGGSPLDAEDVGRTGDVRCPYCTAWFPWSESWGSPSRSAHVRESHPDELRKLAFEGEQLRPGELDEDENEDCWACGAKGLARWRGGGSWMCAACIVLEREPHLGPARERRRWNELSLRFEGVT